MTAGIRGVPDGIEDVGHGAQAVRHAAMAIGAVPDLASQSGRENVVFDAPTVALAALCIVVARSANS